MIRKIQSIVIRFPRIERPIIVMTLLVKDEEEVLEQNILFHKKMGVDGFIITDNGSTDGTGFIIEKYKEKGWVYESIYNPDRGYRQDEFVNKMIMIAKEKYNADWIINADADEFWFCRKGNYREVLGKSCHNVISCGVYNMYPNEDVFWKSEYTINNQIDLSEFDLPKYNLFSTQFDKVIHRTKGYKRISVGNHNVKMKVKSIGKTEDIIIYHYNVRSKKHFYTKFIIGGKNVFENKDAKYQNIAEHWRYFYLLSKEKNFNLEEVYEAYIGKKYFDEMIKKQYINRDRSVKNVIEKLRD